MTRREATLIAQPWVRYTASGLGAPATAAEARLKPYAFHVRRMCLRVRFACTTHTLYIPRPL